MAREGRADVELFALPGVPAEMTEMWNASVAPAIAERLGPRRRVIRQREIRCFGAGESEIESRLPDLVRRGQDPLVGITASQATITLRVTAEGATVAECNAKIEPTVATIYDCLGPLIFGEGNDELQDAVACLLSDRGRTLATVEWGTAGLVASWLGGVPGSRVLSRRPGRARFPDPGELAGVRASQRRSGRPSTNRNLSPTWPTPCANDSPATMAWPSARSRQGTERRRRARRSTSPWPAAARSSASSSDSRPTRPSSAIARRNKP